MRSAARPAHSASSSAIASNIPVSRSTVGRATTAPRCARASTSPLAASWRNASRTGVRDTLKRCAMSVSSSAAPGGSAPRTISSASCSRNSSARVILSGIERWRGRHAEPRPQLRRRDVAARGSEDRQGSCLFRSPEIRFVDDADMGGDDFPALGEIAPRSASAARPCPASSRDRTMSRPPPCRGHRW